MTALVALVGWTIATKVPRATREQESKPHDLEATMLSLRFSEVSDT